MLKYMRLKNFVHFQDEHNLSFDEGSYYFIGQHESGKSCMFEAIRRCMSTSKSMGMSSCHQPKNYSTVICDFELTDSTHVKSGLVRIPKQDELDELIFVKFVFAIYSKARDRSLLIDLVKESPGGGWAVNKEAIVEESAIARFEEIENNDPKSRQKNFTSFVLDELCNCIEQYLGENVDKYAKEEGTYNKFTACEEYLINNIDTSVLIVYPIRAIATGQWTKSSGFGIDSRQAKRARIENEITERSEILSWFFGEGKDEVGNGDRERERERQYFKNITNNESFTFTYIDKTIKVQENATSEMQQLIKVPDGYLEAKHCEMSLALEQYTTVCIEEAGKGMHPQLIKRLRDLILKTLRSKVVIVTSHSPSMLSFWNLLRIFFFRKIRDKYNEDMVTFSVKEGKSILPEEEHRTSRMITNQSFSSIFFARRVLYVEGESDSLFLCVLKQVMLQYKQYTPKLIQNTDSSLERDTFNKCMYSLQIIPMHGEKNKVTFRKVSQSLLLKHFFILDYDAIQMTHDVQQKDTNQQSTKTEDCSQAKDDIVQRKATVVDTSKLTNQQSTKAEGCSQAKDDMVQGIAKFVETFKLTKVTAEEINKNVDCLEKEGIFVWQENNSSEKRKQGTLERALISLVDENESMKLQEEFMKNNVNLQWNADKKTTSRHKFGSNKQLTEQNVKTIVNSVLKCCLNGNGVDFKRLIECLIRSSKVDQ